MPAGQKDFQRSADAAVSNDPNSRMAEGLGGVGFDTQGTLILRDDCEGSVLNRWSTTVLGAGTVTADSTLSWKGNQSIKLTAGGTSGNFAQIAENYVPVRKTGRVAMSFMFNWSAATTQDWELDFNVEYYSGDGNIISGPVFQMKRAGSNFTIQCASSTYVIPSALNWIAGGAGAWHRMKLVLDTANPDSFGNYPMNCYLDNVLVLSLPTRAQKGASGSGYPFYALLGFIKFLASSTATTAAFNIDDVNFTIDEP